MKFKIGDKVKYEGRIHTIIGFGSPEYSNDAIALDCLEYYAHRCYLEKVEDMEEFKFGEPVYCGEDREKRFFVAKFNDLYYVTEDEYIKNGVTKYLIEPIHKCYIHKFPFVEYSMQEIADALKVDIKDLRIKK